jgi:DNA-binding MarR family transcriptional regulator
VQRVSNRLQQHAEAWLAELGLSFEAFSLIVTLRRAGAPFALRPTDLYRDSLLSSGAITNRIDRVEKMGLVRREPDPRDRRATLIRLTPSGRSLADRAITRHFTAMAATLSVMPAGERARLAALLAKLLAALEHGAATQKRADAARARPCPPRRGAGGKLTVSKARRRAPV